MHRQLMALWILPFSLCGDSRPDGMLMAGLVGIGSGPGLEALRCTPKKIMHKSNTICLLHIPKFLEEDIRRVDDMVLSQ